MSDINFLNNKQSGRNKETTDKVHKKEEPVWSNPLKAAERAKNSPFSFLPFSGGKNAAIDKNKIKKSRQEILALIKRQENLKSAPKEKNKSFLTVLAEKLKKMNAPKEALIDYQRIFDRKKGPKEPSGQVIKPPLKAEKVGPEPTPPAIKSEDKPAEIREIKFKEPEPKPRQAERILETNLMRGELAAFFDWRSKIIILAASALAPLAIVAAVYYGLAFYQKSSQAKNSALAQKFAELEQEISREESGLEEILAFQPRLKTVSEIFKQHLYWTNFFKFLEDNTIKGVYFTGFQGDTSGNYALDAVTANYGSIAEQIKAFRDNKKITAALASGGELAAGDDKNQSLVKFILDFSILKSIFTE